MPPVQLAEASLASHGGFAAAQTAQAARQAASSVHLLGPNDPPCGIGDFATLLHASLSEAEPHRHEALILGPGRLSLRHVWQALGEADALVANFPVVAWKRALVAPAAIYAMARLRGSAPVTVLHEWAGLHRLRRLVLRPLLLMSDTIFLVSPQVQDELAADPIIGHLARRAALMPVPPNLSRPARTVASTLSDHIATMREEGRLVLGHFGSIYPGKQPEAVLEIAAELKGLGANPLLVFVGSFIQASDGIEAIFWSKVKALGLEDDVIVSGYVASEEEMFGIFEKVDAFAYVLPEGLTARRASVLACVQAGRPVVVTAPLRANEFDHHPRYRELVDSGAIVLVPREAGAATYASQVLAARGRATALPAIDRKTWFRDAADALRARLRPRRSRATA